MSKELTLSNTYETTSADLKLIPPGEYEVQPVKILLRSNSIRYVIISGKHKGSMIYGPASQLFSSELIAEIGTETLYNNVSRNTMRIKKEPS